MGNRTERVFMEFFWLPDNRNSLAESVAIASSAADGSAGDDSAATTTGLFVVVQQQTQLPLILHTRIMEFTAVVASSAHQTKK